MANLILDIILSFFFIWLFVHGWHAVLGDLEPRRAPPKPSVTAQINSLAEACRTDEVQSAGAPEVAELANSR